MGIENHFSAWLELSSKITEYILAIMTTKNPGACLTQVVSYYGSNFTPDSFARLFPAG